MAKYKRTHFFINRELQGKYMLSFAIPMFSLLIFFGVLFYFSLVQGLEGSLDLMNNDISEYVSFSLQGQQDASAEQYKETLLGVQNIVRAFAQDEGKRNAIAKLLGWIIIPGFILIMVQVLILTIFFSHKLAGPAYRLEIAMNRVVDGDYTEEVRLRDGDQLKNLAELFNEVVEQSAGYLNALKTASSGEEREKILEKVNLPLDS